MGLLESLADGHLGIRWSAPASWSVLDEDDDSAHFLDEALGNNWWVFFEPDLHLDLGDRHAQDLEEAARLHARAMFDSVHAVDEDYDGPPRTSDPDWSPLVDFERSTLQGQPTLRSIHRMKYRPGSEIMLGHLLVPRPGGLFEARVMTVDHMTGVRESLQVALGLEQGVEPGAKIPQATLDDPSFDEAVPKHCLSRCRAALRWLTRDAALQLDPAELPSPADRVTIAGLGCAVRPPPRFFATDEPDAFLRTSFCCTDGIERFFVARHGDSKVWRLVHYATRSTRQLHEESDVEDIELHVRECERDDGPRDVLVVAEGDGLQGRLRNVVLWRLDRKRRPWRMSLTSTVAVPRERLVHEMLGAAASWQLDG